MDKGQIYYFLYRRLFFFYGGSDKKDNALLYEVEYLISGKNSDIDNLKE